MNTDLILEQGTLSIMRPNAEALLAESRAALARADFVFIDDDESLEIAKADMNALAKRAKEIESARKAIVKPLDEAKKSIQAAMKPAIDNFDQAVRTIKSGIASYVREQERKAAEERRIAEEKAAAERAALETKAAEAQTEEEAAVLQEAAAMVVAEAPKTKVEKKGMTVSKKWKANVIDMPKLLHFVADHPECSEWVEIKTGAIDRYAAATSGAVVIPGLEFHQETVVSARG